MRLAAAEAERDAALRGAAVALRREEAALRRVAELEAMLAAREELGPTAAAHALVAMGSGGPPAAGSVLAREAQNVATPIHADAAHEMANRRVHCIQHMPSPHRCTGSLMRPWKHLLTGLSLLITRESAQNASC
eukprot:scaffold6413_cov121-Isochrysis_galbana.AAC.2